MQTKLAEIISAQGKGNGRNYLSVKEEDVALLVGNKIERDEKQFRFDKNGTHHSFNN